MKITQYRLEYIKKIGTNSFADPVDITDMLQASAKDGIEGKAYAMNFTLQNKYINYGYKYAISPRGSNTPPTAERIDFTVDSRVRLFAWSFDAGEESTEPVNFEDKFIFDGTISSVKYSVEETTRTWTVETVNTSTMLLRNLLPAANRMTDEYNNSPAIIRAMLRFVNSNNASFVQRLVKWDPDNDAGFVVDSGSSGSRASGPSWSDFSKSWTTDAYKDMYLEDGNGDIWGIASNSSNNLVLKSAGANPQPNGNYRIINYSNFRKINFFNDYKPVYQMIKDLSELEYVLESDTSIVPVGQQINQPFYFYIRVDSDGMNYLVWRRQQQSWDGTLELREGVDLESYTVELSLDEMVNAMILNAGKDANRRAIHTYRINTQSMQAVGARWKYYNTKRGEILLEDERRKGSTSPFDEGSNYPPTFPHTTYFKAAADDPVAPVFVKGQSVVVANKSEFNNAIRRQAKIESKIIADNIMKKYSRARFKLNAVLSFGDLKWRAGSFVRVILPTYGWRDDIVPSTAKFLRIREVSHEFSKAGWRTVLDLLEDWETVEAESVF